MRYLITALFVGLALPAPASAENGCLAQVSWFIKNVPNLETQTGIGTEEDFLQSPTRLLLAMSAYAHALGQLQSDASSKYWQSLLVVTDGLTRCFEGDQKGLAGDQLAMANEFHKRFSAADRARFLANANRGLGN